MSVLIKPPSAINKLREISFSNLTLQYTSKDFYKKYFFHRFRNFKSFTDQLADLNAEDPTIQYEYEGLMFDDLDNFDFRHLLFDYFFSTRTGDDADVEMGVGLDFNSNDDIPSSPNNLPDYEALKWIPFNDIYTFEAPDYSDPNSSSFAAKSKKISLHTYPSFKTVLNGENEFNKNWFKHFRLNDEAQVDILTNNGNVTVPITQLYIHLSEMDEKFPADVVEVNYTTTKKIDGKITNYDEVRSLISKVNDYSEVNFNDPIWKIIIDGDVETVESVWQLKDIGGQKVLGLCMGDNENNIIHERYSNGQLYAVNIPSENIYRNTSSETPTYETITIPLKNNIILKSNLALPYSGYNNDGNNPEIELDEYTPLNYCKEDVEYVDVEAYLSNITDATALNSAITNLLYSHYIGKLFVMGKTNMRAKPYDEDRSVAFNPFDSFSNYLDENGYVYLDIIRKDLNARIANFAVGGLAGESATYPWKDENEKISYKLFSKFEIETHYVSGEVIDGEITADGGEYFLTLKIKSIPLSQIKEKASPMGNIFGASSFKDAYNLYGEKHSLSDYMTSFRFFDPIVMDTNTNDVDGNLDSRFWFCSRDTFGAACPSLNNTFFNNIDSFKEGLEQIVSNDQTASDPLLNSTMTDVHVYFGMFMGEGLWQKGMEIIIDQNFSDHSLIKQLFTDMETEFEFIAVQHDINDFDFTSDNLPEATEVTSPFNLPHNIKVEGKTIMPQIMFFIPWNYNQAKERWWLYEKAFMADDTSTMGDVELYNYSQTKQYSSCYVQYKEEVRDIDQYVHDYHDEDFSAIIERIPVDREIITTAADMLYAYRPVRHFIQLYDSLLENPGQVGYKFDLSFAYTNGVANANVSTFWDYLLEAEYVVDVDALDELKNQKQLTGTYYYLLSNEGADLILPGHNLYEYTVITPGDPNPPAFFRPGDIVSLSIKGIFDNKDSVEIKSPTINEIVKGVSHQYTSEFRGVQSEFVRSQLIQGGTHFNSAIELNNDRAEALSSPYGDCWVKIGDIEEANYDGGYKMVNHNYYLPSDWALNGVFVTGKQWSNGTDVIYNSYNPSIAHFFIDNESEISYSLSKSGIIDMNKLISESKLYLGSFVIPPKGYFNINENSINVNDDHQQSLSLIKEKQNNDVQDMKLELYNIIQENDRENLNGLMFSSYAVATQTVKLQPITQEDKNLFNNIKEGTFIYQDNICKGTVMKKINNTYMIIVKLYNATNMINSNSKIKIVF